MKFFLTTLLMIIAIIAFFAVGMSANDMSNIRQMFPGLLKESTPSAETAVPRSFGNLEPTSLPLEE